MSWVKHGVKDENRQHHASLQLIKVHLKKKTWCLQWHDCDLIAETDKADSYSSIGDSNQHHGQKDADFDKREKPQL